MFGVNWLWYHKEEAFSTGVETPAPQMETKMDFCNRLRQNVIFIDAAQ